MAAVKVGRCFVFSAGLIAPVDDARGVLFQRHVYPGSEDILMCAKLIYACDNTEVDRDVLHVELKSVLSGTLALNPGAGRPDMHDREAPRLCLGDGFHTITASLKPGPLYAKNKALLHTGLYLQIGPSGEQSCSGARVLTARSKTFTPTKGWSARNGLVCRTSMCAAAAQHSRVLSHRVFKEVAPVGAVSAHACKKRPRELRMEL